MAKLKDIPTDYRPGYLDALDGRTAVAQELRERYQRLTTDLGGHDALSYQRRSMVERVLFLEFWLQQQETELAQGKDFDVSKWIQAHNSLIGAMRTLGLDRVAKDVPDLQTYLAKRGQA